MGLFLWISVHPSMCLSTWNTHDPCLMLLDTVSVSMLSSNEMCKHISAPVVDLQHQQHWFRDTKSTIFVWFFSPLSLSPPPLDILFLMDLNSFGRPINVPSSSSFSSIEQRAARYTVLKCYGAPYVLWSSCCNLSSFTSKSTIGEWN